MLGQCSFIVENYKIYSQYCSESKLLLFEITCGAFDVSSVVLAIKFSYLGIIDGHVDCLSFD